MSRTPSILFIGGHDPSGGAGLHADIETAVAHGCRSYSLITCLTTQDSKNVQAIHPQPVENLSAQFDLLLQDVQPDIVKIGLIGNAAIANLLGEKLSLLNIPLVLDPVLAAGGGKKLAGERLLESLRNNLLPITTLITPNRAEARRLSKVDNTPGAASKLLSCGCQYVLITGADEAQESEVTNTLFLAQQPAIDFHYPLLPHRYHGSGCTLAAACTSNLAQGKSIEQSVADAQHYTWQSLQHAEHPGQGQHLPKRR